MRDMNERSIMAVSKITKEEVKHVAKLARLAIDEEAMERYAGELSRIIEYVGELSAVDTDGVKPTMHTTQLAVALRADVVAASEHAGELIAASPESAERYVKTKPVFS
jgi:aspartyl-tRNA(Asn)/glutamyl-tRNA(Gln) amidotransferase subunit C